MLAISYNTLADLSRFSHSQYVHRRPSWIWSQVDFDHSWPLETHVLSNLAQITLSAAEICPGNEIRNGGYCRILISTFGCGFDHEDASIRHIHMCIHIRVYVYSDFQQNRAICGAVIAIANRPTAVVCTIRPITASADHILNTRVSNLVYRYPCLLYTSPSPRD